MMQGIDQTNSGSVEFQWIVQLRETLLKKQHTAKAMGNEDSGFRPVIINTPPKPHSEALLV